MNTIQIEIPDGKKAEWVNGVLTLVDEKPIEHKFNVGDHVMFKNTYHDVRMRGCDGWVRRIANVLEDGTELEVHTRDTVRFTLSTNLEPYIETPKPITERIKTFEDTVIWCRENGKNELVDAWNYNNLDDDEDIVAYLKLRIITAALNEGWEPNFAKDELRYYCICGTDGEALRAVSATKLGYVTPWTLYFKSRELAQYAANQFRDIYADFCGCKYKKINKI